MSLFGFHLRTDQICQSRFIHGRSRHSEGGPKSLEWSGFLRGLCCRNTAGQPDTRRAGLWIEKLAGLNYMMQTIAGHQVTSRSLLCSLCFVSEQKGDGVNTEHTDPYSIDFWKESYSIFCGLTLKDSFLLARGYWVGGLISSCFRMEELLHNYIGANAVA